jgi:hypothetical protein
MSLTEMQQLDTQAIKELRAIMDSRGVDYHTGLNISLAVRRVTRKMVDWLKENPEATVPEMTKKAWELNKIR